MSATVDTGLALTLATIGQPGSDHAYVSNWALSFSAAGIIRRLWNGALTFSITALRAPRALAAATALSTYSAMPEMTTCPGELKFAAWHSSFGATSRHTATMSAGSSPMTAAIAPTPSGADSCIQRPRLFTRSTASRNARTPEATRAVYSPRLCPAPQAGEGFTSSSFSRARSAATLVVMMAGCVLAVSLRVSSGPSKIRRARCWDRASSASSKTALAEGKAS